MLSSKYNLPEDYEYMPGRVSVPKLILQGVVDGLLPVETLPNDILYIIEKGEVEDVVLYLKCMHLFPSPLLEIFNIEIVSLLQTYPNMCHTHQGLINHILLLQKILEFTFHKVEEDIIKHTLNIYISDCKFKEVLTTNLNYFIPIGGKVVVM